RCERLRRPDSKDYSFSSSGSTKCSGRHGSDTLFSSLTHLPKSTRLHRFEQNGPYAPANQSPRFLHVGHRTFGIGFITVIILRPAALTTCVTNQFRSVSSLRCI